MAWQTGCLAFRQGLFLVSFSVSKFQTDPVPYPSQREHSENYLVVPYVLPSQWQVVLEWRWLWSGG